MQYNYSIELIPFPHKKRKESDYMPVYQEKNKNKLTKDGRSWYYRCYYTDIYGIRKQKISILVKLSAILLCLLMYIRVGYP